VHFFDAVSARAELSLAWVLLRTDPSRGWVSRRHSGSRGVATGLGKHRSSNSFGRRHLISWLLCRLFNLEDNGSMTPQSPDPIQLAPRSAVGPSPTSASRHTTRLWRKASQPAPTVLAQSVWGDTQIATRTPPWTDEGKTRALWQALPDLVFIVDRQGQVLEFQAPPDLEYPVSAQGVVGRRLGELLPSALAQQVRYYIEKALRMGSPQVLHAEYQVMGRTRTFQARMAPCSPDAVLALVRDVTDRVHMEQELLEISHREQMRIGQDLHDGLGQHLTGITFLLRALEKKLAARQLPEAAEVAEVLRLVMQALAQTRSLARGLVPVELESKGLRAALQELAATAEHVFRIRCTAAVDEAVQIHDQAVATHLFRLAQEALNNAVRHGKAKHVTLELTQAGEYLALTIQDDGVGLPKTGPPKPGLGLKIMQYRAQKLGGVLQVQPGPHGGTVVSCIFPCPPQPAPSQTEPAADAQLLLAAGAQPAPAHAQPSPEGSGLSHLQPI